MPAAAASKSLQSCPTLCDPIDGSPPGSLDPGILQARTLEWVAISFSSVWKWKVKVKLLSRVRLLVTPWTAAHQAPPSVGFSRQEYWLSHEWVIKMVCQWHCSERYCHGRKSMPYIRQSCWSSSGTFNTEIGCIKEVEYSRLGEVF